MEDAKNLKRPRLNKDLGPLHELLTRGLPEFTDENGRLDPRQLAVEMGISYQAVYLIFKRGSISKKRIATICYLSHKTKPKNRPKTMELDGKEMPWKPLVLDDFWPFMG